MIDYWLLAKDFAQGDTVQQMDYTRGALSPFVGKVTAVHPGLGLLDVQWPFGNERVYPDDVVLVNPELTRYLPPTLNQSYSSYDTRQASVGEWRDRELPAGLFQDLASYWRKGANEVVAYDDLYRKYSSRSDLDDLILRSEVSKFYRVSAKLLDLRLETLARKTAAYWAAQNRQYRVSQQELQIKKPNCPRCGSSMRRTTYKMDKGARVKLFACPKDLYLIKQTSLLGPTGEPVEW